MHVGIKVPNWGPLAGPDALARTAIAADERGFGSVWVSDHVAVPVDAGSHGTGLDPRTPFLDALGSLAFLAGVTRGVQLGTGVLVLPLRQPLVVAKAAGTVDVLSGGRLLLGTGVGWLREEFDLLGLPFEDRGRRTDEAIGTLRDAWAADGEVAMHPRPAGRIPVLVGGHSPAALRRAVRLGDGWYGSALRAEEFGELAGRLGREAKEAGREVLAGTRVTDVEAADAPRVVAGFARAGADFVILDRVPDSVGDAVGWIHRTADALSLDPSARHPLTALA